MAFGLSAATVGLIGAGVGVAGGLLAGNATKSAANTQAASADRASQLANDQYMQTREDQAPWRAAGQTALASLSGGLGSGGQFVKPFSMADYQQDPGYQFRLSEGQKGVNNAATASGSKYSGATLKALSRFNSDQASQEYGAAYNRYNTDNTNAFNRLASVAGLGQTATAQTASAGAQAAATSGQAIQNAGTARASGYVGTANAINGTLGNLTNSYNLSQLTGAGGGATVPYESAAGYYNSNPNAVSNVLY